MPDNDLEAELRELGRNVEYPRTPDIASRIRARLDHENAARRSWFRLPALSPRLAVAAAILQILVIPALSPTTRGAISGLFVTRQGSEAVQGAGGVAGGSSPDQGARVSGAEAGKKLSTPASIGSSGDSLGQWISVPQARARMGGRIYLPHTRSLGAPDEIYAGVSSHTKYVVFVYHPRPRLPASGNSGAGLLLTQFPDGLESVYTAEGIPNVPRPEKVSVGGKIAYWCPEGDMLPSQAANLSGGALLWEINGHAMLLRASVPREQAVRIANSVR